MPIPTMPGAPPSAPPAPGGPGGMPGGPGGALNSTMSGMNPMDAARIGQGASTNMTVRDFLSKQGIDVDGPVTQLIEFAKRTAANATPMGKMQNMGGGGAALSPGGQPPVMPGAKPMVAPPGQPGPQGLQGLMSRLGGK